MSPTSVHICPRCGAAKMKAWDELSVDEQKLVRSLSLNAEIPLRTRKKHRFCTRCWFETRNGEAVTA